MNYQKATVTVRFTLEYTEEFDYCEMMNELQQRLQEQASGVQVIGVEKTEKED